MVVTLLLLVPLLAAVVLLALRPEAPVARAVAVGGSALSLLLAVGTLATDSSVDAAWVRSLGIRWSFAADGVSAALILLTTVVGLLVVLHSAWGEDRTPRESTFLGCLLLVEFGSLATFLARDALLFLIAFEIVLAPMWVLIRRYGDDHAPAGSSSSGGDARFATTAPALRVADPRADAAGRFVLFTAFGSALLLVGLLLLVTSTGTSDLRVLAESHGAGLTTQRETLIAAILVIGLGVKVPLFGLHTWLPSAHTVAPTAGSVLLAAVLLKLGTYGLVRIVVPSVPEGLAAIAPALAIVGAVGVIWAGLLCLVERDIKRLIAYSSIAHMGFVAIAVASGSQVGIQAALFANIAHGLVSALLFFVVGDLKHAWGSGDLAVPRPGLRDAAPRRGLALLIGLAASLGLPGLVSFWGEILALYSAWMPAPDRPAAVLRISACAGVAGLALAAGYSLRVARLVWAGDAPPGSAARGGRTTGAGNVSEVGGIGLVVLVTLCLLVVLLGVWPNLLLDFSAADAAHLLEVGR